MEAQRVSPFWQEKYRKDAAKSWNIFYKRNETRFFRDRHWIDREFPELFFKDSLRILEVGCGVGNFCLPFLEQRSDVQLFACDFSERAIELLQQDARYQAASGRCQAIVADITKDCLLSSFGEVVDTVTCIFVLSALPPEKHHLAVETISSVLRPGGLLLIRDYACNDAAQNRFKPQNQLGTNLFVRQDGTLAYFFNQGTLNLSGLKLLGELAEIFRKHFDLIEEKQVESKTTNIKKELEVDRHFVQLKLRRR